MAYDARSVCVPSARPGYMRFMFLPSTGLRCGTIFVNDGTFSSGTTISVPASCAASTAAGSCSSAMIDAYSVPCAPAMSASTGPGRAPFTTTTGIERAASTPAGTSMVPAAVCPGAALAVPTANDVCASAFPTVDSAVVKSIQTNRRLEVMVPPGVVRLPEARSRDHRHRSVSISARTWRTMASRIGR